MKYPVKTKSAFIHTSLMALLSLTVAWNAMGATRTFTGPGNFSDATKWSVAPNGGDGIRINGICTNDNSSGYAYGDMEVGYSTYGTLTWPVGGTDMLNVLGILNSTIPAVIDMSNGGTIKIRGDNWSTGNQTFQPGTGTIIWNNTGAASLLPGAITNYYHLIIDAGTRTVTMGGNLTINGNFAISSGTLDASASNYGIDLKGNWTNNGTAFIPRSGTVNFKGTSAQFIGGTSNTTFNNLTISNASSTVTLGANTPINNDLSVVAGTFDLSTHTADRSAGGGGTLTVRDGATLKIGGTNTLPSNFSIYNLGGDSTVNYSGQSQLVTAQTYGNLILSGSGAKNMLNGTVVSGNLSVSGTATNKLDAGITLNVGTLTLGGVNKVSGTWGSSSSSATHKNDTYFSPSTGILNVLSGGPTPAISDVTASQAISYGTVSIMLTGKVSAAGPIYPADGETVGVTINGVTSNATVAGGAGGFSVVFPTATIPYSATPYTITYSYAGDDNLNPSPDNTDTALTVNKAAATVQLYNLVTTYNGTACIVTNTTTPAGLSVAITYAGHTWVPTNAASYAVTGTVSDANYQGSQVGTLVVSQKELTVTGATAQNKEYDGNNKAQIAGATLVGKVGSDDVNLANATTGTFAQVSVGTDIAVATAPMTITGASSSNYKLTQPTGLKANITKATATVQLYNLATTYNGTARTVTNTTAPAGLSVVMTYNGQTWAPTNAGSYAVTGMVSDVNYQGNQVGTLVVSQKELTVTGATAQNKEYDGNNVAQITGATLVGKVSGDDVTLANATTGTFVQVNVGTDIAVSTAPMTISGAGIGNYTLTQPIGLKANITKATATVQLYDLATTYNGTARAVTNTTAPAGLEVVKTYDGHTWAPTNAGSYAVTGTVNDANYQGSEAGTLVVSQKELTVTGATAQNKVYDGNNVAQITGATLTGKVGDDDVTLANATTGTFAQVNAGTGIAVATAPMAITGAGIGNYTLTQPTGLSADILKVNQTISFGPLADKTTDDLPFGLSATGGASGNPIVFSSLTPTIISVSGTNVTIVGAGLATIRAEQAESENYLGATNDQSFTVSQMYGLTASAGAHGSIEPLGEVRLMSGSSTSFVIAAASFYHIDQILTNANPIADVNGLTIYTSVWADVTADGTIGATFAENLTTNDTPEWWLNQNYPGTNDFNNAALSDTDGDGMSAWQEYIAGTEPTNFASRLVISEEAIATDTEGYLITWLSATDRYYSVSWRTNLLEASTPLVTNLAGTPPANRYTDTVNNVQSRIFYRITVTK